MDKESRLSQGDTDDRGRVAEGELSARKAQAYPEVLPVPLLASVEAFTLRSMLDFGYHDEERERDFAIAQTKGKSNDRANREREGRNRDSGDAFYYVLPRKHPGQETIILGNEGTNQTTIARKKVSLKRFWQRSKRELVEETGHSLTDFTGEEHVGKPEGREI